MHPSASRARLATPGLSPRHPGPAPTPAKDRPTFHLVALSDHGGLRSLLLERQLSTAPAMPHNPTVAPSDWRKAVSVKRASIADAIPPAWRLNDEEIPSAAILKDLTSFITRFLSPLEQQITTASVSVLMSNICSFQWSAVEVTRAFCHRAALAHQLVSGNSSNVEH